ncbi:extracellular solute-binding protein [Glycomyces buryatensis]|uniref:Extracellular solute-binding protein n=1 Tax=Glycomyces buryatensis TaxID=2570927 RepID=A0A4S8PPL6_9ACTN|nr:extracellular solute-binding protein [Glycomyces buryatensis]THV32867.1 extracellular solute-binding protein [Glycomyces buryatensis]
MKPKTAIPTAVLAVGSLALTGCSGGDSGSDEPLESLDIMAPYFSEVPPEEDDPIDKALSEVAGLDLSVQWVPNSDYAAKTNTVLAGDDIPDVMVIGGKDQSFVQTAEAGGFWDLTEHLASGDYPNLVTENPEVQEASSVNGKVYGVYRARDVIRHSVIIRADWLENLGMDLPETTDDLYELARAFTEDDPDGNGENDTYGMINVEWPAAIGTNSPYDAIEVWHGAGNVWQEEGGELTPSFESDEWRQAVEYERDLVENGYLNPDYATMAPETWNEPFLNGEGGIIIDVQSRASELVKLFNEQDPENYDQYVALAGQLEGPNGTYAMPTAGYAGFLAIPRSGVQTEEQLDQVLTALDKLNSTEAQILLNNGIEGDNFTVEGEFAVNDPEKQDFTDQVTGAWAQLGTAVAGYNAYTIKPASEYDEELLQLRLDLQAEDLGNAVFNPAAALVSPTYTTSGSQLDTIIADARIQYIDGQIDDAGLQSAIDQWRSSGGGDVETEINDLYAELQ